MFRFTSINDYHAALVAEHTTCTQAVKYYLVQIGKMFGVTHVAILKMLKVRGVEIRKAKGK